MPRNECSEFERAAYADSEIPLELRRHAERCERCRFWQQVVALSAPPVATERADPFAERVTAAATQMSRKRAESSERRRTVAPLLIGAAGYLVAIGGLVSTATGHGAGAAAPAPLPDLSFPSLPAPDFFSVTAVLLASAAATAVVAFFTRDRHIAST
jgi:hypothetical protein